MVVGTLRRFGFSIALGSCLALGCGGEKSEMPAADAAAPTTAGEPGIPPVVGDVWLKELPGNFPEDVPLYPGAEVLKARPGSEANWSVGFSTPDDPAKVAAYFADAFAAQGWSTQRVDAPEGIMVFADKGDRSATYGVGSVEGKTQIDLLIVEMR